MVWEKPQNLQRGAGRRSEASGGFGKALGGLGGGTPGSPGPGGCSSRVPEKCQQKPLSLGSIPLHLRGRAPSGRHVGGSRPALPGLHDVLCRSRSSGSFGLRVAVVEPSA